MKRLIGILAVTALMFANPAQAASVFIPIIVPMPSGLITARGNYDNFHTVAILSAIGTGLYIHGKGLFAKPRNQDIADWKIDDEAISVVKTQIGNRFSIIDVNYSREELAAIPNGPLNGPGDFQTYLQTISAPGVDAFIVIRPDNERNMAWPGLSFTNGNSFNDNSLILRANYEIDVVDAKTFKIVAKGVSRYQEGNPDELSFAQIDLPVSAKLSNDTLDVAPPQLPVLRDNTHQLVDGSVAETLASLGLGHIMIAPDQAPSPPH